MTRDAATVDDQRARQPGAPGDVEQVADLGPPGTGLGVRGAADVGLDRDGYARKLASQQVGRLPAPRQHLGAGEPAVAHVLGHAHSRQHAGACRPRLPARAARRTDRPAWSGRGHPGRRCAASAPRARTGCCPRGFDHPAEVLRTAGVHRQHDVGHGRHPVSQRSAGQVAAQWAARAVAAALSTWSDLPVGVDRRPTSRRGRPVSTCSIGLPKTGTSHLQQVLWRSRKKLAAGGVLAPGESLHAQRQAIWDLMAALDPSLSGRRRRRVAGTRRRGGGLVGTASWSPRSCSPPPAPGRRVVGSLVSPRPRSTSSSPPATSVSWSGRSGSRSWPRATPGRGPSSSPPFATRRRAGHRGRRLLAAARPGQAAGRLGAGAAP